MRLLPKRIVAFDAEFKPKHFRIHSNWIGSVMVMPQSDMVSFRSSEDCMVCVDPKTLFRRRAQFAVQKRDDLNRLAGDLFPFAEGDASFAAGYAGEGAGYVFALPANELAQIQKLVSAPIAGILASSADKTSIESALAARLYGAQTVCDLKKDAPRFLSPAMLRSAIMAAGLVVTLLGGSFLWHWQNQWHKNMLRNEIAQLQTEVAPVQKRAQALELMQATMADMADLQNDAGARVYGAIGQLMSSLPSGMSIDRVEYKEGKLSISGLGKSPQNWLTQNGIAAGDIQITAMPQIDRYVATMPIK